MLDDRAVIGVGHKSYANAVKRRTRARVCVWREESTPRVRLNLIKGVPSRTLRTTSIPFLCVHSSALTPAATRRIFSTWSAPGPKYRICGQLESSRRNDPNNHLSGPTPQIYNWRLPPHAFTYFLLVLPLIYLLRTFSFIFIFSFRTLCKNNLPRNALRTT